MAGQGAAWSAHTAVLQGAWSMGPMHLHSRASVAERTICVAVRSDVATLLFISIGVFTQQKKPQRAKKKQCDNVIQRRDTERSFDQRRASMHMYGSHRPPPREYGGMRGPRSAWAGHVSYLSTSYRQIFCSIHATNADCQISEIYFYID